MLIAGQSVLAASDTHLSLQAPSDHQDVNHYHDEAPAAGLVSGSVEVAGTLHFLVDAVSDHEQSHNDNGDEQSIDCQHCCHCHSGTQIMTGLLAMPLLVTLSTVVSSGAFRVTSIKFPPGLRPPIV